MKALRRPVQFARPRPSEAALDAGYMTNDNFYCDDLLDRTSDAASGARRQRDRLAACLSPHEWLQQFDGVLVRREERAVPDPRFDLQHCVSALMADPAP